MYSIFKAVIEAGRYELSDMLTKIDTLWVQGSLSDDEKTELVELAKSKANPGNSYAPMQKQIDEAFTQIQALANTVKTQGDLISALTETVEGMGGTVTPPDPTEPEEWPEWYKWNGVGKCPWQKGSKCTHNGKRYISRVADNIWEPGGLGVYDNIWEVQA